MGARLTGGEYGCVSTPTAECICSQVGDFIRHEISAAQEQPLGNDDSLLGGNVIDSMAVLKLIVFVETTFDMTLDDEDVVPEHFETITRVAKLVQSKLDAS